jgi:hypothetical protein
MLNNTIIELPPLPTRQRTIAKRLFLEAWYSLKDNNAGNDHVEIPDVYKTLIC